jgi:hypothetical protein
MISFYKIMLLLLSISAISYGQNHILITEIVVTPTEGEFVEIYNNTGVTIDLTDYYLTDGTESSAYYYNIVTGANAGGEDTYDFHVRFPTGSTIAAGEFQTIAINGANFVSTYGSQPTYEIYPSDAAIPDMIEAFTTTIGTLSGLSNAGEVVILYYWDGQSDLVQDIDYLVWGDKVEAVDKSGVSIDGPDPHTTPSTYLNDTGIAQQISASSSNPHAYGESLHRLNLNETGETQSGGNGITGHDETSEDLATSFQISATPNPGTGPSSSSAPFITNITTGHFDANVSIDIDADITDDQGIDEAWLHYRQNLVGTEDSVQMSPTTGDTYQGTIPAQTNNTALEYWVSATDIDATSNYSISNIEGTIVGIADISRAHEIDANGELLYEDFLARIKGIVTVATGTFSPTAQDEYMQDNTGGINIFDFAVVETLALGDSIEIEGKFSNYFGKSEIVDFSINILSSGNPLPDPVIIATTDMAEQYEGMLIRINQGAVSNWVTQPPDTNFNALFTTADGDLTIRVDKDTDIGGNPAPAGLIDLVGIGSQNDFTSPFTEGYQILPRSWADFIITNSIEEENNTPFEFSLKQNYPNPFNPDTKIEFSLATTSDVKLVIYNLLGQEINSFSTPNVAQGVHQFNWDGRDHNGLAVASGIYIYQLTAGDPSNNSGQRFVSTKKMVLLR